MQMASLRYMKLMGVALLLAVIVLPVWAAFQVPRYENYVTDTAQVISPEAENAMNAIGKELKEKTKAEVAVLTVDTLDGTPIEQASLDVGRTWGVGDKKTNTGLVMLIAVGDRKMRIEVGYGLEGIITDGTAGEIRDQLMRPAFKQGNYELGIGQAFVAIANLIARDKQVTLESLSGVAMPEAQAAPEEDTVELPDWVVILFFIGLIGIFGVLQAFGWLPFLLGGGGSYRGGGGDGGFGGFGGGSFGGGGASGDW